MAKKRHDVLEEHISSCTGEAPLCACFNIRKAARAVTQFYDDALRPSGLRTTQFSILVVTGRLGPMSVTRLAEQTVTDRTTLTRNLKLLEKQKLIQVGPGQDRREREVTLTGRGRAALAEAYPLWKEVQSQVARSLGPQRLDRLMSDLRATVRATRSG